MNKTQRKHVSAAALRKKLFSAAAMLLVASIMLVSTSYAWLVLSTAPEVKGITTQVGANGALEIVLLDSNSYADLTQIAEFDIDESLEDQEQPASQTNLQWGNLVSLGDNDTYGLDKIILNPGRLYIEQDGDAFKINPLLMKTPIYNEDGRIVGLDKEHTVAGTFVKDEASFPVNDGYGVRAIGLAANMSEAQMGINAARAALSSNMATARTTASRTLNAQGNALGGVAVGIALGRASGFTVDDVKALKALGEGLQSALDQIDTAVRQVFVGYIYTQSDIDISTVKAEIEDKNVPLTTLGTTYPAVLQILPAIRVDETEHTDILTLLEHDKALVKTAIDDCQDKIDENKPSYEENEIIAVMRPLVQHEKMTMGGYSVTELKSMVSGPDKDLSKLFPILSNGLTVNVPSGSGILSDISDFAGNYTADVVVEDFVYEGIINTPTDVEASMATQTALNPVYLTGCLNSMRSFIAADGGDEGGSVITDYYGYAIDLAFRTNAGSETVDGTTELLLQTESAQRIYDESNNAATQGGGSYMSFKSDVGLSATKMTKLLSGVRVVFTTNSGDGLQVLAIAALDTQLTKRDYTTGATTYSVKSSVTVDGASITPSAETCTGFAAEITKGIYDGLEETTKADATNEGKYILGRDAYTAKDGASIPAGKYAVLRYDNPQNSDYITEDEYNELPDGLTKEDFGLITEGGSDENYAIQLDTIDAETQIKISKDTYENLPATSTISVSADGTVKAKLYLHDFTMPTNEENGKPTGAIALGNKRDSAAITTLEENVPKQVTAMVYLDGSIVNNSMVAANSNYSMTGTLNLQFASSAELVPMNNQELFDGKEDAQEPEAPVVNENGSTPAEGGDDDPSGSDPANGTEGA